MVSRNATVRKDASRKHKANIITSPFKPSKIYKSSISSNGRVGPGTKPKLSSSQVRKLILLYTFTSLSWKNLTSLITSLDTNNGESRDKSNGGNGQKIKIEYVSLRSIYRMQSNTAYRKRALQYILKKALGDDYAESRTKNPYLRRNRISQIQCCNDFKRAQKQKSRQGTVAEAQKYQSDPSTSRRSRWSKLEKR